MYKKIVLCKNNKNNTCLYLAAINDK